MLLHSWPEAHALQTAPAAPHDEFVSIESGSHVPALQQPVQSEPPQVQAPLMHCSPLAHMLQAAPPMPHSIPVCELYGTQVLPLQQPLGHEVALQMHCPVPVSHASPEGHAAQLAPPAPHSIPVCEAYSTH